MKHNRFLSICTCFRGTLLSWLMVWAVWLGMQPAGVQASTGCLAGAHCVYLPVVTRREPAGDLVLGGVEVTQGIQDLQNSVPLVAGRRTVVRIYAWSGATSQPLSGVNVLVTASSSGSALNSSPAALTATLPLVSQRSDYASTINYELPSAWLEGTVDLTIRLDPADDICETNESNNVYHLQMTFNPVPDLQVKIIPVEYTHADGVVYPAPTSEPLSDWIMRTYPVSNIDLSWHAAYPFTGDLTTTSSWYALLDQITALKSVEGAPSAQVYYALVPISNGSSTWFRGSIAGIGWIGSRVSVGLNTSTAPLIAAHEIGHNLGMWHAPCGGATFVDPNFPYPDGSIGQYGLDLWSGRLYSPSSYRDFMSYCDPRWISDYTYQGLYQSQVRFGASPLQAQALPGDSAQRSLLVRYRFDPDGVQALPAYVLPGLAQPEPEAGDYTVQVLDAAGQLLSATQVQALTMALDGAECSAIHAVIPLPDQPAAKLRLLRDGQVLAEQLLQLDEPQRTEPVRVAQGAGAAHFRWVETTRPVLVRYSSDGGQTWVILGMDAAGGDLPVSVAALPGAGAIFEVIPASAWVH